MKKLASLLTAILLSNFLATVQGIPVVAAPNSVIFDHFEGTNNGESVAIAKNTSSVAPRVGAVSQVDEYSVTPGNLTNVLSTNEKNTLTTLKLSGSIDARDFKTMRDMPMLTTLDLSLVNIVAYSGVDGPRAVDTYYPENTIPRNAFFLSTEKSKLTTVIHPASLKAIGRSAYNLCSGLININFPPSINSIGYAAFLNCRSLKSVEIPFGVTVIDTMTFYNCTSLTSVTVPSSVKEIRYGAFMYCSALSSINLMPGTQMTHIGVYAFGLCSKLTSFTLDPTVSFIGNVAFLGSAVELSVPANNPYYSTVNGVLYDKALTRLMYCPSIKTGRIDLPPTVTSIAVDALYNCSGLDSITLSPKLQVIEDWAFENCTGLKTLSIPASVNQIWAFAFYNCSGLKNLYVNTSAPVNLIGADSVFNYIDKNACTLYVLAGLKAQYQAADKWNEFANIVERSNATAISPGTLHLLYNKEQRSNLKMLSLMGSIDARDFLTMRDSMPMLEYIDLSGVSIVAYSGTGGSLSPNLADYPANTIPDKAFLIQNGNHTLKTFVFPKNLTRVGLRSFIRCDQLISAVLPPSVTTLGDYVFYGCTSLKDFYLPPLVTRIPACAFIFCPFTSVNIPNGIKNIGDYAFQSCNALEHVTLPASVDSIGYCSFTFNNELKSFEVNDANPFFSAVDGVLFDKAVKTLVSYPNKRSAYYKVPDGVQVIDTAAFEGCWALYKLDLPTSLTRLCTEAFYECNNLRSIEIPASVTSIESYVFFNCYNLTLIIAKPVVPVDLTNATSIFGYVNKQGCLLRVPTGSKAAYLAAARWGTFGNNIVEDFVKQVTISAGSLFNSLTSTELNTVTHLKISGTMDARDFVTMRESMPMLAEVDLQSATIVAYNGGGGTVSWSTQYQANAIPPNAFFFNNGSQSKKWLTKILFPTSLTTIGDAAFTQTGLRTITLHEGITRVDGWALSNTQLSTIAIPASLTNLGDNALGSNPGLYAYTIAAGNPNYKVVDGVLYDKSGLTLINYPNAKSTEAFIPEGVTTIKACAFQSCDFINALSIPSSVNNIIAPAFSWAGNLKYFDVSANNAVYCSVDGVLFNKERTKIIAYPNQKGGYYNIPAGTDEIGATAFRGCWNLNVISIPNTVTKIGNLAFNSCSNLTRIILPFSINTIEYEAFSQCTALKSISVSWNNPLDLTNSANVFNGVDKSTCVLKVPNGTTWNYRMANQWGEFNTIDERTTIKYTVVVPTGTKACYIAGEMNGWTQQPMNKESSNMYRITLDAFMTDQYKYCSGPDWTYEELDNAGNVINDRNYNYMDTVKTWRNVYQPWMPYSPWKIETNPSYSIGKIQFVSLKEGWIASGNSNGLLHTLDGGETWNKVVPFPDDRTGNFSDPAVTMDWINPTHGWVMKTATTDVNSIFNSPNGAVLYSTTNGGNEWVRKTFPKSMETITYASSDLQGTWQVHEIMEANYQNLQTSEAGWAHLKIVIDADGMCTISDNVLSSGSFSPEGTIKMNLAPNGQITMNEGDFNGYLSPDKKEVFFNMTTGNGENLFGVMQRQVPNTVYQLSDLMGFWQMHSLIVNNPKLSTKDRAGWLNAFAMVDGAGNAQLSMVNSKGDISSTTAQMSITPDGFVSIAGLNWHGFMNAEKTAFYSTFTDNGGESYDFCLMQKQQAGTTYSLNDLEGNWRVHDITLTNPNVFDGNGRIDVSSIYFDKNGKAVITNSDQGDDENKDNYPTFSITSTGTVTSKDMVVNGYMSAEKNTIIFTTTEDSQYAMTVLQKDVSYSGDMGLQVQFADENNGWASTYNWLTSKFKFYRSSNGGLDWNDFSNNMPVGFYDFVDANNGWAISMPLDSATSPNWAIVHTTDGGLNWSTQYSFSADGDRSMNALQFTDLNHGWVTGDMGLLLKTDDGGLHWTEVTNTGRTMNSDSKALYFLDANTGWVTSEQNNGDGMVVLHTTNGGASWSTQYTNLFDGSLYSLCFWDENHGWFTGEIADENSTEGDYIGIIGQLNNGPIKLYNPSSTSDLLLYPNPVKDGFYIRSLESGSLVSIHQMNGTVVLKQQMEGSDYVDVRDLKKGMYLVRIKSSKGVVNKKIVKM